MIFTMKTENLSTLKIHKLTQEQYQRELEAGRIDENALYLTPDEDSDLSQYATTKDVEATYETKTDAAAKLTEAKEYTNTQLANSIPTKVSELTNDAGYLNVIPDEYVTETELAAKGYLTSFTETDPTVPAWAKAASKPTYTAAEVGAVPTSRTVNGKALSSNITLSASDVGALPSTTTIPTVNNATLTIQKNGTNVATFTANSANNATANITVPTGAAADKGVDTSISAGSTSTNLPTSKAVAAFVEGKGYKTTDNNTTYAIATGDSNGQIKVTPSSGSAYNVSVKGLGSAAYTASTAYATSAQGTKADNAVPNTRKVNGKALSSDITLSASDVSARPATWTPSAADVGALPSGNVGGTTNRISKFTASNKLGNSNITDDGSTITLGTKVVLQGNGSSYNEGLRILPASNGWSNIFFSADATVSGQHDGGWLIGRRGAAGGKCGAVGDFTIENNASDGAGLTLHKNGNMSLYGSKFTMAANKISMQYDSSNECLNFVFA